MKELRIINGIENYVEIADVQPTAEELRQMKLAEIDKLKEKLVSLDYKTIKRMQGKLSDAEWEETCELCDNLRKRINELEKEIDL